MEKAEYEVLLYFPDDNAGYLQAESREIKIAFFSGGFEIELFEIVYSIIEELKKGPETGGLGTAVPSGAVVNSLGLGENGLLEINFNKAFEKENPGGSASVSMVLGQLVLSLTEIDGINSIKITIDGKGGDFKGLVSFDNNIERNDYLQFIKKQEE